METGAGAGVVAGAAGEVVDGLGDGLDAEVGSVDRGRRSGGVQALSAPTAPAVSSARLLSVIPTPSG